MAASNVYPIAPRGTFDAGDAGLRSSGTVVIVADKVVNASNIVASGTVSGSKAADTSGLGGALAAPPTAPVTKAESFSSAAAPNPDAASSLTVEFLGYGAVASAAPPAGGVPLTGAAAAKPAVPPCATPSAAPGKPPANPCTAEQQAQW